MDVHSRWAFNRGRRLFQNSKILKHSENRIRTYKTAIFVISVVPIAI